MPVDVRRPTRSLSSRASSTILETVPSRSSPAKAAGVGDHNAGRLKDFVDSYLRQLFGGSTPTRLLAAQALGALSSFLPPSRAGEALRLGVELGVVGSLTDVLTADDELPVQEACLMGLAALLLSTSAYEDHSAVLRPQHLKLLGALLLRPDVMEQIGYLVTVTSNSRVVLAAARVVAIMAPYITQSNDVYLLDSRIVPALLKAAAARPDPGGRGARGGGGGGGGGPTPRDAAVCVLALLTLAQTTPDMHAAVCTADFLQAISVLYERSIDPNQPSDAVLPADAAGLLLRAATLGPDPRWGARLLPAGYGRLMERNIEESDVAECLVSFLAVEAANLRRLGEDLAVAAEGNAEAVVEKNGVELEHLASELKERRQQLAEAAVAVQDARRSLEEAEAEAEAARAQEQVGGDAAGAAGTVSVAARRRARKEAEAETAAAEAAVEGRRRGVEAAEAVARELRAEVTALRRAAAPLKWQRDRMAQLAAQTKSWREQYGFKSRSKLKLSRPNMAMLTQVLSFLAEHVKPPPAPERGNTRPSAPAGPSPSPSPGGGPSREHAAALQAKLLEAGLVQAVLQLFTVLSGVQTLAGDLATLAGDLALQPAMLGALGAAQGQLTREAEGLAAINKQGEMRLGQVYSESSRLRKALLLETPLPPGSPCGAGTQLGPGNGLSRTVRQEDVQQRLESLNCETRDLEAALGDSKALVEFLQGRIQVVSAASSALADSYAIFAKAFPTRTAPAILALAPAAPALAPAPGDGNGHSNEQQWHQYDTALRLASHTIMAKDAAHPAGHLLGLLSRALAPVTRGSVLNLPALVRQLLGRPPNGAAAPATSWPPPAPPPPAPDGPPETNTESGPRSKSTGSAVRAAGRPRSAGSAGPQRSSSPSIYGNRAAARPGSARSATPGPLAERSNASGVMSSRGSVSALYGGGGGPFPTDAEGRPMRHPRESMYGSIHAPFSPRGSYSPPHKGPRFPLLMREKTRDAAAAATAHPSSQTAVAAASEDQLAPPELTASVSRSLADESRRVVHQVVSSILFDTVDADALGPGITVRTSTAAAAAGPLAASLTLADGLGGSRRTTLTSSGRALAAEAPPLPEAAAAAADGGVAAVADGGDMSVLDALLLQSELLGGVMEALAELQQFAKATSRTCRQLPTTVSYASLQPGGLGPYMARLHAMWAGSIPRFPDMRLQIADAVSEIARLALVPGADFRGVYQDSGVLEALVQMLAGGTRPGQAVSGKAAAAAKAGAGGGGGGGAGAGGRTSRPVPRLTATAPPCLRLSPAQQAEQAAAGRALRAISQAQSEVLVAIGQDEKLLSRLSRLVLDHSVSWAARQTAADLLGDLVLGGGPGAEAAVAAGAYAGLVEMVNRDMYPFLNQDPRSSKETVVSALASLAGHGELLDGVVAAAQAPHGPSAGLPLSSRSQVLSALLRSLWGVCWQAYTTYTSDRAGHGRHVDPQLVRALTSTAATAARELAVLADTVPDARRALIGELGLRSKIGTVLLQAIKDPALHEALVELRKNLS